jgi:hypothetical protein
MHGQSKVREVVAPDPVNEREKNQSREKKRGNLGMNRETSVAPNFDF